MKKVLAAALLCAVSSFAAWDKFPVLDLGKGEGKIGFTSSRQGPDGGESGAYIGVRYVPMENLELMATGADYTLGARYQVVSLLAAGVDVGFPIPEKGWRLYPNIQASMDLVPNMLSFGSNVGLEIHTEDAGKYAEGMNLDAGIEFDISMGKSTIWLGLDIGMGLGKSSVDGDEIDADPKDEGRGMELSPGIGYIASPTENLSLQTFVVFNFGEDAGHDKMNTTLGVEFAVKF